MTDARPTGLNTDQLVELFALAEDADSVELKLTVPDEHRRSAVASLDLDPIEGQLRQVIFFDTPDLALNARGVVVRARRVQGGAGDSVVKLRPVVPGDLPKKLRRMEGFGVEVDAMPGGFVCSARLKAPVDNGHTRQVLAGSRRVAKLFTKAQRAFFAEHAGDIGFDDLAVLGPINIVKLKFTPTDFDRRIVVELWFYPDGSRILELSTKCLPKEALDVAAECRLYLTEHGVDLTGEQQTKTKTALEFYANELRDEHRPAADRAAATSAQ